MTSPSASVPRLSLIYGVIGVCIAVELVLLAADWGLLPLPRARSTAYEYGGFWPGLLFYNYPSQPYVMYLSYAWLHSGIFHLVVNMFTLWSLGREVVFRVGNGGFILLYGAAVLGGAIGFGLLSQTTAPMVGASGGLFGLVGGILAWNYVDRFVAQRRLWPVLRATLGLIALNLILWWAMDGLLAWQTHLGGFVAGWVAALLIDPRAHDDPTPEPETSASSSAPHPKTPHEP